jgi:tetratricopeptide (TPR) repeat protein
MMEELNLKPSSENGNSESEADALDVGLVQRLTTSPYELAFLDALKAQARGNEVLALQCAHEASALGDGAFLGGLLALRLGKFDEAETFFKQAWKLRDELGQTAAKYEVNLSVEMPLTDEISTEIAPNPRGVLLGLVEAYQNLGQREAALHVLQDLYAIDPDDLVTRLSMAELMEVDYPDSEQKHREIIALAEGVHNASPIHASLMFYRARALRKLGLLDAAQDSLSKALRRHKDYPNDLLIGLRYERALVYQMTGKDKQARTEFEKIYAEAPTYEDVAARIGL